MARVAVVHHEPGEQVGRLQPHLDRHRVTHVWAPDDVFPREVEGVLVMGGSMGAYETDLHPWLVPELTWLARMVDRETPVLGICLGAQLLAAALGGRAWKAPEPEIGVIAFDLTESGRRHPVMSSFASRAYFAHQDSFDLPPGAELLARTAVHPAAFALGSALAIQPHPEAPAEMAMRWADDPGFDMLDRAGMSRDAYERQLVEHEGEADAAAGSIFGVWFGRLGDG